MQKEIDQWSWQNFHGELVFHLAAVPFGSGKLPNGELKVRLEERRVRPLVEALRSSSGWSSDFFSSALNGHGKCSACGATDRVQVTSDGEDICDACARDEQIGLLLPRTKFLFLTNSGLGTISVLGLYLGLHGQVGDEKDGDWLALGRQDQGLPTWDLLRHVPIADGRALDFDQIAKESTGRRKWLAYLRIDADHMGRQFEQLKGDPLRVWSLSRLLHSFFTQGVDELLQTKHPTLYVVYGGGDDLFVIGPWSETLQFALRLRQHLRELVGNSLTVSAGISLAKPRDHILARAREAAEELEVAKQVPSYGRHCGRDQIRALGVTASWETYAELLDAAKRVSNWLQTRELSSSFLYQVLELHQQWCEGRHKPGAAAVRYKPLLHYQIHRNLKPGAARDWARSLLGQQTHWPWVDFVIRYAILAAGDQEQGGE